jgi:hypothetical protein
MRKQLLWSLCIGMALAISTSAYAGGTYHHSDPVFVHSSDKKKINHRVVRYSPEHRHYHVAYGQ